MKQFCFALQHLTRITLYKGAFDETAFGRATVYFPAVGLLLGVLLILVRAVLGCIFPAPLLAAMLVAATVVMTGGLHLDGFMDTVDGVFSGRPRERKLEIMRDSRVGAFGVLAVVCLLLLKYNIFLSLSDVLAWQAIIPALVLSRWAMVYAIARFPYARPSGLGTLYKKYTGGRELLLATASTLIITGLVSGIAGLLLLPVIWAWVRFVGGKLTAELGGLTGDTYGATAELTELLVYLAVFPLYGYWPGLFYSPWF